MCSIQQQRLHRGSAKTTRASLSLTMNLPYGSGSSINTSAALLPMGKSVSKLIEDIDTKKYVERRQRQGAFILKLHTVLLKEDSESTIVQWSSDGTSFLIRDTARFAKHLLPNICSHSTFASFERQMNFYGFERTGEHDKDFDSSYFRRVKLVRRGSAIRYRHKDFNRSSSKKKLNAIKRRTYPTKERTTLSKKIFSLRAVETQYELRSKRLSHVIEALYEEIDARKQTILARPWPPSFPAQTQPSSSFFSASSSSHLMPAPPSKKIKMTQPATLPATQAAPQTNNNEVDNFETNEGIFMGINLDMEFEIAMAKKTAVVYPTNNPTNNPMNHPTNNELTPHSQFDFTEIPAENISEYEINKLYEAFDNEELFDGI